MSPDALRAFAGSLTGPENKRFRTGLKQAAKRIEELESRLAVLDELKFMHQKNEEQQKHLERLRSDLLKAQQK